MFKVVSAQFGVGTSSSPFECYLDSSVLTLGANVYSATFDAPNTDPMSTFFDCPPPPSTLPPTTEPPTTLPPTTMVPSAPACACDNCPPPGACAQLPPFAGNWGVSGCVVAPVGVPVGISGSQGPICIYAPSGAIITGIDTGIYDDCFNADNAAVNGNVEMGLGNDCTLWNFVNSVSDIETGDGDDFVRVTCSTFEDITTGDGNDYVELLDSTTGDDVALGDGDDVAFVGAAATIDQLMGGEDFDVCFSQTGATIGTIACEETPVHP